MPDLSALRRGDGMTTAVGLGPDLVVEANAAVISADRKPGTVAQVDGD
jgi:hypothetical protein